MILTFTGESGTGKTTIARRMIEELPLCRMLISVTTRAPRRNDIPGEYEYVTEEAFSAMVRDRRFEWTAPLMRGKNYGTPTSILDAAFDDPETIFIMILVPEAMAELYAAADKRGLRSSVRSFFIRSPDRAVIRKRLMDGRGLSEEQLAIDIERCRDWEEQARASGLPYIYIEDADDLDAKFQDIRSVALAA